MIYCLSVGFHLLRAFYMAPSNPWRPDLHDHVLLVLYGQDLHHILYCLQCTLGMANPVGAAAIVALVCRIIDRDTRPLRHDREGALHIGPPAFQWSDRRHRRRFTTTCNLMQIVEKSAHALESLDAYISRCLLTLTSITQRDAKGSVSVSL